MEAERVQRLADFTAAVSVDAFHAQVTPFHPAIQQVRNHQGQIESAANVLYFLSGSQIAAEPKNNVQDPYSFRCVPQVHGAVKYAVAQVRDVFEREINAVTDNPLIFEEEDLILSGGNFHGEPSGYFARLFGDCHGRIGQHFGAQNVSIDFGQTRLAKVFGQ
jgi:histidine ammonia-lyase